MTTIICGFPGIGKSWLFKNQEELGVTVKDSDSSQFSWIPDSDPKERNPMFPANYVQHIKDNMDKVDYIMVSTHKEVLDALVEAGLNTHVILIYPQLSIKKEYIQRYIDRGSPEAFVNMLQTNYDQFIVDLEYNENFPGKVKLQEGEYLSDVMKN